MPTEPRTRERPAAVTTLAAAVFLLAGINLGAATIGLARWAFLAPLDLRLPVWAHVVLGALWGCTWLVVGRGLWRLRTWARLAALILFPLYELVAIGQQWLFAREAYARGRLPFAGGSSILLVALLVLVLTRPRVRRAFDSSIHADSPQAGPPASWAQRGDDKGETGTP